jgi:hypothetical protein
MMYRIEIVINDLVHVDLVMVTLHQPMEGQIHHVKQMKCCHNKGYVVDLAKP